MVGGPLIPLISPILPLIIKEKKIFRKNEKSINFLFLVNFVKIAIFGKNRSFSKISHKIVFRSISSIYCHTNYKLMLVLL